MMEGILMKRKMFKKDKVNNGAKYGFEVLVDSLGNKIGEQIIMIL